MLEKIRQSRHKERFIAYPVFLIVSVLFLLAFSLWESPLYKHWYGCDASFFSMVGRGILNGWVPYRDTFDLKGPYFFFLQALGQLIHTDRLGIWILEIPFLFASLILMYELARLFVGKLKTVAIMIIVLFMHVATLWGGNTVEEYMLPLNLLVIFLTLRAALPRENNTVEGDPEAASAPSPMPALFRLHFENIPTPVAIITGICFGVMLFAKVTVASPIAGVVIAVCLNDLLDKNFRALFRYLAFAFLGVVIAALPIFLYFGYHDMIPRMLYCVFEFATKRSVDFSEPFNKDWELKTIGAIFAFLFALFHPKRLGRRLQILLLSMAATTYLLLHLGVPFIYYFATVFPVLALSLAVFLKVYDPLILFSNIRQFICLATIGVMLYFYANASLDTIDTFLNGRDTEWYEEDYQACRDLASLIPERERDQVFSFSTDMIWFEVNQILPCNPYQVNLQFFIALDPSIEADLTQYLNETPPKWLVVGDSFEGEIPSLYDIVFAKYDGIGSNGSGNLYLLRDD